MHMVIKYYYGLDQTTNSEDTVAASKGESGVLGSETVRRRGALELLGQVR
jgi:hypothetical protein